MGASKPIMSLRAALTWLFSAKSIPVCKATLAYLLGMSLILTKKFEGLNMVPPTLSAMIIVTIAGGAGGSVGACLQGTFLAFCGVLTGTLFFLILAKLHSSHVAQGVIFAIFVYFAALLKAQGQKWFAVSLLAVLTAFNGVYTSILVGTYNSAYLKSYLEAYLWGGAITLSVNLLVFPRSAEKDLRQTLVLSLQHLGTFAHLLAKTYTLTITEEEKRTREHLAQALRADFGLLNQKISETTIEVNFSRYSIADYQLFVSRTRALQVALISAHSNLAAIDNRESELFKRKFLQSTLASFNQLRRSIEISMREICLALQCKPLNIDPSQAGYRDYMDLEKQQAGDPADDDTAQVDLDQQLEVVSRRLAEEINVHDGDAHDHDVADVTAVGSSPQQAGSPGAGIDSDATTPKASTHRPDKDGASALCRMFDKFSAVQHDILAELLATGCLHGNDDELRMHQPQPSTFDYWRREAVRQRKRTAVDDGLRPLGGEERARDQEEKKEDEEVTATHHSLLRIYSFLFAMRIYIRQLEMFHGAVIKTDEQHPTPPGRRLQIHLFQSLQHPHRNARDPLDYTPPMAKFSTSPPEPEPSASAATSVMDVRDAADLSVPEALALLENRPYVPTKLTVGQRLSNWEQLARSPQSVFALKTAAGATVFAMLIFANTTRAFFLNYSLTGGVLTLIVAISPTLGQSLLTFVLQILGSGAGYLWGVAILMIFRNVGGYHFNPFGVISLLGLSAFPLMYLIYNVPKFFVFSLLALNSAGVLIATEWIYVEDLKRPFDTPIFRAAKAVTALGIALGVAVIFQVFVLRNPARRTLRKKMGELTFSMLGYATLFQAYTRAVIPAELDDPRPPLAAIQRVEKELKRRELKMQAQIIEMNPLMAFAAAEPEFSTPFRGDLAMKIIRCNQVMLDRIKEARSAIGSQPVPDVIRREFSTRLSPYRRRNLRLINGSLYVCASSLMSKAPLPTETPAQLYAAANLSDFMHDALLISSRVSLTDEGKEAILNGELTRYWAYIMTITSVGEQLLILESVCKEKFGDIQSKLA